MSALCIFCYSLCQNIPSFPRSEASCHIVHFPEPSRCLFARYGICQRVAEFVRTNFLLVRRFRPVQHPHRRMSHYEPHPFPRHGRKTYVKPFSIRVPSVGFVKVSRIPGVDMTSCTLCAKPLRGYVHKTSGNDVEVIQRV
jgi:hypothetical protein